MDILLKENVKSEKNPGIVQEVLENMKGSNLSVIVMVKDKKSRTGKRTYF